METPQDSTASARFEAFLAVSKGERKRREGRDKKKPQRDTTRVLEMRSHCLSRCSTCLTWASLCHHPLGCLGLDESNREHLPSYTSLEDSRERPSVLMTMTRKTELGLDDEQTSGVSICTSVLVKQVN